MAKRAPVITQDLRSDVLWDMVYDRSIEPHVRAQLCEIARYIDGERLRLGYFIVK